MAYFLEENDDIGEIATFVSPKIFHIVNNEKDLRQNEITDLVIYFLGKKILIYVDIDFLKKYNIPLSNRRVIINENDNKSTNLYLELKAIRPSLLKSYLDKIKITLSNK